MIAVILKDASAEEIAALVLAIQERQAEDVSTEFAAKLHQELQNRLEEIRGCQESR